MKIETTKKRIQQKIEKLHQELEHLQLNCPHAQVNKQYRGDTGNYDHSLDGYWIDYHCQDCDLRWSTNQ
jgi:hypothetical protein